MTAVGAGGGPDELPWLDPEEKEAWTGLVSLILLLPGRLEAPLQAAAGLTLFEYLVLSHMSDVPENRIRMSELAYLANGSLSRLSNVVKRFEQRGWVIRAPDPGDGRYIVASLTEAGRAVVVAGRNCGDAGDSVGEGERPWTGRRASAMRARRGRRRRVGCRWTQR